jgi:hypothetical protein
MKLRLFRGRARRRRHAVVDLKSQGDPGARAYRVYGRVGAAFRCEGVFRVQMTPSAAYKRTDPFLGMARRKCSEIPLTSVNAS